MNADFMPDGPGGRATIPGNRSEMADSSFLRDNVANHCSIIALCAP